MTVKISSRQRSAFEFHAQCRDENRLPAIPMAENGVSALEAFSWFETHGGVKPTREPVLLSRALNGKEWHGLTVMNCAEDFVGRILFSSDLLEYPEWVRKDILGQAAKIAMKVHGYVPTFVQTGNDFSVPQVRLDFCSESSSEPAYLELAS